MTLRHFKLTTTFMASVSILNVLQRTTLPAYFHSNMLEGNHFFHCCKQIKEQYYCQGNMTRVSHWGTMEYHGAVLKLMTTVSIFQDQICPARQVAGLMIAP